MAMLSKGITVKMGETTFEGIQTIPAIGGTPSKIDITTLKDAQKHYITGLLDPGDMAIQMLYNKNDWDAVTAAQTAGTAQDFVVTFPDGNTASFSGTVSAQMDSVGTDAAMTFTCNIALSTDITWGTATNKS
jgi:hypothetical protein